MEAPNPSINVKELRESRNLSRRKVAIALDIADMTVIRWETGVSTPHLPLVKIKTLMELFECDFMTLYSAFEQTAQEKQQSTNEAATAEKIPVAV
jgi:transcriptional regulator with XRE-family HTH domain